MTSIHNIYDTYNFSERPCYVIEFSVTVAGYLKIEKKLPSYIQKLKGVFASVSCKNSANKLAGNLILNFNGQALKNFQMPLVRTNLLKDHSHPIPFDEEIQPNSLLQGFYYDNMNIPLEYPYTLRIYLHYEPITKK